MLPSDGRAASAALSIGPHRFRSFSGRAAAEFQHNRLRCGRTGIGHRVDHGIVPGDITCLGVDVASGWSWFFLVISASVSGMVRKFARCVCCGYFAPGGRCHLGDRPLIGGNELCHGDAFGFVGGVARHRNFAGFRAGFLVGGGLQQFDRPIMERSAGIVGDGMHQTGRR